MTKQEAIEIRQHLDKAWTRVTWAIEILTAAGHEDRWVTRELVDARAILAAAPEIVDDLVITENSTSHPSPEAP